MSDFVLVHGGWAGGWQWREVAQRLRAANHEVFTPTLTGLGERAHLGNPELGLETHVQDILGVLEFEELHEVVLVGYSYSGMVITGVAERAPERLRHLVYVDAFVPRDGESTADLLGSEVMTMFLESARAHGDGWRVPHFPPDAPRRTPQPLNTAFGKVTVANPAAAALSRTFLYCTEGKDAMGLVGAPIVRAAEIAKVDPRWRYRELRTTHVPLESAPREFSELLLEVVRAPTV